MLLMQQRTRADSMLEQLRPIADPLDCKLIAVLAGEGLSAVDIAERLEVEEAQVLKVLQLPSTTKLIFKYQSVLRFSPEQQLQHALPRAVEKLIYLMNHADDEKVQKGCASEVIDRVNGKPIQTTIISNLNTNKDVKAIDA